jgi:signal peptidase I
VNKLYYLAALLLSINGLLTVQETEKEKTKPESADVVEFQSLFDGKSLAGWEGDDRFWRVENGVLIGQTTKEVTTEKNTFLICKQREFADFELRFSYRVNGGNSGVQYRSQMVSKWVVKGLQADFEDKMHEGRDKFSGMFFEENGRMFMGQRGDVVVVRSTPKEPNKPKIEKIATVGSNEALEKHIRRDDWNDYTVIAKGNVFMHIINGHVMSVGIDEDELNAKSSGIIAWQLHAGPPLKIEMKDVRIRELN